MKELFEKIYIKSEADLPKEEDVYFVLTTSENHTVLPFRDEDVVKKIWLETIVYYLQLLPSFQGLTEEAIIEKQKEYIALLGKELDETASIAHIHGWRSSRVEEGKILREEIASAILALQGGKNGTVHYIKSEYDIQIGKMTKIFGKKPDVFEQGVNALIAIVEGKINNPLQGEKKDFTCDKCGKGFNNLDALAWHKTYKGECKGSPIKEQPNTAEPRQSVESYPRKVCKAPMEVYQPCMDHFGVKRCFDCEYFKDK